MSKHTEMLWQLGEFKMNQLLALGVKLGGPEQVEKLLGCNEVTVTFGDNSAHATVVGAVPILDINRAKPFDPAVFIGAGWSIWRGPAGGSDLEGKEQQDERSRALSRVDLGKARFETCLAEGEVIITGEERLRRLLQRKNEFIRADAAIGVVLLQQPGQVILEWLYQTYGVTWFELPGTELRDPLGNRCFLCLCRGGGGRWRWSCYWLGFDRRADFPALVLAN